MVKIFIIVFLEFIRKKYIEELGGKYKTFEELIKEGEQEPYIKLKRD